MNHEFRNLTPTLTPEELIRRSEERAQTAEGLRSLEKDLGMFYRKERRREARFNIFWKCVVWLAILSLAAIAARLWT